MNAPVRSRPQRLRVTRFLQVALCALLASAGGVGPVPFTIENGGFEHGLAGWKTEETNVAVGDAVARAQLTLSDVFGPGTGQYVAFTIVNNASGTPGGSSATTGLSLRHTGIVAARFIDFEAFGFWSFIAFGEVGIRNFAEVIVRGTGSAAGKVATFQLITTELVTDNPCGAGIVADFAVFPGTRSIDLFDAGFQLGDRMELEVKWDAKVSAEVSKCNQVDLSGGISFDDFAFRN